MLTKDKKQKAMDTTKIHDKDTGSPDAQISIITERMNELSDHLKANPKDLHSRRGLLGLVAKRRSLLSYLSKKDSKRHIEVSKKLGIKIK